jgi:hypothetical protein
VSVTSRAGGGGGAGGGTVVTGSTTPTDNQANPTNAIPAEAFNMVFDGANWDKWLGSSVAGAGNVVEQLAPQYEDNANGIALVLPKPLAVATYCASVNTNKGVANAANIKNAPGNLFSVYAYNTNGAARFLFFVDSAGAPVAGSASLICPVLIPAGAQVYVGESDFGQGGINFPTGIGLAFMTTVGGGTLATAGETFWTARFK